MTNDCRTTVRVATPDDAGELLEIYAPYVTDTAVSFEYDIPAREEFERRMRRVLERYPYLVAVTDGGISGYAYAGAFKERPAYAWSVETTVYVGWDLRGRGIGRALYTELERLLRLQGVLNMNACIASPRGEDSHLTDGSVAFHGKMGFSMVGRFHGCGYKFDRWYDMVWMEKSIGDHMACQPAVRPFNGMDG